MSDIYIQSGFDRLKAIEPNFKYEKWYFNKVLDRPDIANREFYTDSYKTTTIDLFSATKINGTFHPNYNNIMWIEMLGALDRYNSDKYSDRASLLDFIHTRKQGKNLNKYGDCFLIGEGNHRFCLAKFLSLELRDITVTEYEFNYMFFSKYSELKKRNILINEKNEDYWTLKLNGSILIIIENCILDFIELYDEIQIKSSFLEKFYQRNEKHVVSSSSDIKKSAVSELIKMHKKNNHYD